MNSLDLFRKRNDSMRLLSKSFDRTRNVVKINSRNTLEHELLKARACYGLQVQGKEYVAEAVFLNGKRADVFVLDDCEAIEILCSETERMLEGKVKDYPCPVRKVLATPSGAEVDCCGVKI